MAKHGLFLGGVPTEPDVKRLVEAFPKIEAGDEFSHAEIGRIIGIEPKTNRYRTVTGAWKRHMLKVGNLKIVAVPGVGFRVIDGMERVTHDVKGFGSGVKRIRKATDDARRVELEKLKQEDQRVAEHVIRHMEATADHARSASKEIAIEFKPQAQLPRVRLAK